MFILWHGFGWLTVVFLGGFYMLFEVALPSRSKDFVTALSYVCSSVPCWFVGRYFRDKYTTTFKNEETGERIRVRQPYHALFFIPMHFWAPLCLALGVFLLIYPSSDKLAGSDSRDSINLAARPAWNTFTSPAGDFSISTPAPLINKSEQINSSVGTIHRHRYYASISESYFAVERCDYPGGSVSARPVSDVLDGARDGSIAAIHGRLLKESPVALGNKIGRALKIENSARTLIALSRMYVNGDQLYSVIVVAPQSDQNNPAFGRFFDSFRLIREIE